MLILIVTFMNETCQLGTDIMSDFFLHIVFLSGCFDELVNQFQFVLEPIAKGKSEKANFSVQIMI